MNVNRLLRDLARAFITRLVDRSLEQQITGASLAISSAMLLLTLTTSFFLVRYLVLTNLESTVQANIELRSTKIETQLNQFVRRAIELSRNSLVTNALVDTRGRSAYLQPFLNDFRESDDVGATDFGLTDIKGNPLAGFASRGAPLHVWNESVFIEIEKNAQPLVIGDLENNRIHLLFPVNFPPTGTTEGVFVASTSLDDILARSGDRIGEETSFELQGLNKQLLGKLKFSNHSGSAQKIEHPLKLVYPLDKLNLHVVIWFESRSAPDITKGLVIVFMGPGLTTFLLVLLMSRLLAASISRPVLLLTAAAKTISLRGSASPEDIPKVGFGEVGVLAESMRAMAQAVRKTQDELEDRVFLRTRELNEQAERLDSIFSLSPDGFATINSLGQINFVNPALLEITGFSEHEVVGSHYKSFFSKLRQTADPTATFPDLSSPETSQAENSEAGSLSENVRNTVFLLGPPAQVLLIALRNGKSDFARKVLYLRDITKESEIDRMKSEFLSTAAHELRTPMSSILGFSQLLLTRELTPDIRKELYGTIHEQAARLSSLLNELLDLARIEARAGKDFRFSMVSLGSVVDRTLSGLLIPGDSREVKVSSPEPWPILRMDPQKMQQALGNVIGNAYKYSPDGGDIELGVTSEENNVFINISDKGIGMAPEQQEQAFERFYRADNTGNIPGTGLGLSLVKEIVRIHGGDCFIASRPNEGTVVTIRLPIPKEDVLADSEDQLENAEKTGA